jgi:hypothetical protein
MQARADRFRPVVRLSRRVFAPLERLARLAGVTSSEVAESILREMFEGEMGPAAAVPPPTAVPPPATPPASVIPISRARSFRPAPQLLRRQAAELRARAQRAREQAAATCAASLRVREKALRLRRTSAVLG